MMHTFEESIKLYHTTKPLIKINFFSIFLICPATDIIAVVSLAYQLQLFIHSFASSTVYLQELPFKKCVMSRIISQTCQVVTHSGTLPAFRVILHVDMLLLQNFVKFFRYLLDGLFLIFCFELCQGFDPWTCSSVHYLFCKKIKSCINN